MLTETTIENYFASLETTYNLDTRPSNWAWDQDLAIQAGFESFVYGHGHEDTALDDLKEKEYENLALAICRELLAGSISTLDFEAAQTFLANRRPELMSCLLPF